MKHAKHPKPVRVAQVALALLAALPVRRVPRVAAAADHWFARPARGLVCRWLAAGFPVRRDSGGYADLLEAAEVLCSGGTVIVFPEGTRGTGAQPAPFHGGAFALARGDQARLRLSRAHVGRDPREDAVLLRARADL